MGGDLDSEVSPDFGVGSPFAVAHISEDLIKQEAGPLDLVCLLGIMHLAKLSIHFLFQQL